MSGQRRTEIDKAQIGSNLTDDKQQTSRDVIWVICPKRMQILL